MPQYYNIRKHINQPNLMAAKLLNAWNHKQKFIVLQRQQSGNMQYYKTTKSWTVSYFLSGVRILNDLVASENMYFILCSVLGIQVNLWDNFSINYIWIGITRVQLHQGLQSGRSEPGKMPSGLPENRLVPLSELSANRWQYQTGNLYPEDTTWPDFGV